MADTQRDDLQADSSAANNTVADSSATASEAMATTSPTPEPAIAQPVEPDSVVPAPAVAAATEPTLESSTSVPPLGGSTPATDGAAVGADGDVGDGGEWNLLVEKLQQWWASGELQRLWQQTRTPLTLTLGVIAVLLVLRVYAGLVAAINGLPLVPGLLELVGVIWTVRYGLPKLIRRSERDQVVATLQQRWHSFSGRG